MEVKIKFTQRSASRLNFLVTLVIQAQEVGRII